MTHLMAASTEKSTSPEEVAANVINRTLNGVNTKNIIVRISQDKSKPPSYQYHAENGKLYITGNTPVAACRGFYDYLRSNNMGMVGWRGPVLRIPQEWPNAQKTEVTSPFKFNQMYNVVTAGYSFPYWDWNHWQQELDYLALHGYNMIMAPIATEAIAERVWLKLGLTQKEIDKFVCGPAHAPWHRMGNIANVDGPLPPEWHKDQIELQHKILKRAKELGITPIFQCFAGFVPYAIKRLYPNETYYQSHWNKGFNANNKKAPIYLLPDSPLFKKIMTMYINEWEKEFGKGKYYLIDTFNEIKKFPVAKEKMKDVMRIYGKNLSETLAKINPDAVWTLQGWILFYQKDVWTKETVRALLSEVPDDKMLILDMMGEWKRFDGFFGKPWIYGDITNMGGKNVYTGNLEHYINGPKEVLKSPHKGNNVGNSNHSEGIETNEVIFELIADTGWFTDINLDKWLKQYCINRYGAAPPQIMDAWMTIKKTNFSQQRWNSRFFWQRCTPAKFICCSPEFMQAVKKFLEIQNHFKDSPFYVDDAVEMASFVLGQKADEFFMAASEALKKSDKETYSKDLQQAVKFLKQADRLLESHSLNRLERWIGFTKLHSSDKSLQKYYEENAKRIVTSWGPPVNDYSARVWSGLIRDFYIPRMEALFHAKAEERQFDKAKWEAAYLATPGISHITPYKNPTAEALKLVSEAITTTP